MWLSPSTNDSIAGLQLAEFFDFPESLKSRARSIAEKIEKKTQTASNHTSSEQQENDRAYRLLISCAATMQASFVKDTPIKNKHL